tara:strand:+ start:2953 stop:3264 length:312 start_codon:yes stop_codon:yes gene_type:complete
MASLISFSIDLKKIDKSKIIEGKKGSYLNLTASVNDESRFGQNVGISIGQSQEEREAKEPKQYLGNGKVVWTDGSIVLAEKEDSDSTESQVDQSPESEDDLPF